MRVKKMTKGMGLLALCVACAEKPELSPELEPSKSTPANPAPSGPVSSDQPSSPAAPTPQPVVPTATPPRSAAVGANTMPPPSVDQPAPATVTPASTLGAAPNPNADILGIRLGMTLSEVLAVLDKSGREAKVSASRLANVNGRLDLKFSNERPASEGEWAATVTSRALTKSGGNTDQDDLTISFAYPPDANVVNYIERKERHYNATPETSFSYATYWDALQQKYGKPAVSGFNNGMWMFPSGAVDCIKPKNPGRYDWPQQLESLPKSGQCAAHLTAEFSVLDGMVAQANLKLANPFTKLASAEKFKVYKQEQQEALTRARTSAATAKPAL